MSATAIMFCAAMLAAAASDVRARRIPNWMNVSILLAGLVVRVVDGGLASLTQGLLGAGAGLLLLLPLFHFRWIGGGDVKLAAAMGAWLGPAMALAATLLGLAGGGLLAALIMFAGGPALREEVRINLHHAALSRSMPSAPRRGRGHLVPMAVAFAGAAIGVFLARGSVW